MKRSDVAKSVPWIEPPTGENITRAVAWLRAGQPIGLPTETVYGLAADATR
jgi:L-threonylcarbamoyladenylate synthase